MLPVLVFPYKRARYKLVFSKNDELRLAIKNQEGSKFVEDDEVKGWVVPAPSLFNLVEDFKGTAKFSWEFQTPEIRIKFAERYKKIKEEKANEEINKAKREAFNAKMVRYKENLVATQEYSFDFTPYFKSSLNPYKHQKASALWMWQAKRGLLAAEMGLGKSVIFVLAQEINPEVKKVLVICPNSLKMTLQDEIHTHFHSKAFVVNGSKRDNPYKVDECKYFIVNYEYFAQKEFDAEAKIGKFGLYEPDVIVFDESHRLKEETSNTYQNILTLYGEKPEIRMFMSTGTPIKSFSREIFTQLHLMDPASFRNQTQFSTEYCGMWWNKNFRKWEYDPRREKVEDLHQKLQPYMFRILKSEAGDMPEKVFTRLLITLTDQERKTYEEIEAGVANEIFNHEEMGKGRANPMTILLRLREYLSRVKAKRVEEVIKRQLEEGNKVVFVDFFQQTLQQLQAAFPAVSGIHSGKQSIPERHALKTRFIDPLSDLTLFIGSSPTCNAGLTLTVSSILWLNTMEWTVADCEQIFDRIHRIGQKYICNIYLPIVVDTVDEAIYGSYNKKKKVFSKLIDNKDHVDTSCESGLGDVMSFLKKKYASRV